MKKFLFLTLILISSAIIVSCSSDDEPKAKFRDITLNCGQSYTIADADAEWTTSNEYIVSVSKNVITAERVGEALISSSKGEFKVTVNGVVPEAYFIPYTNWGATQSTVKNFMKEYTIFAEEPKALGYSVGAYSYVLYAFNEDRLNTAITIIDGNYVDDNTIFDFMYERYILFDINQDINTYYFLTTDHKTLIAFASNNIESGVVYMIAYMPYNKSRSLNDIKNQFDFAIPKMAASQFMTRLTR